MQNERIRILVEVALAIALAAVLNMLKIWRMPNAGTVSFVMLPIIVVALRRGLLVGLVAGALYGLVDFFIDPFPPVHWIQPLLDYPVAYAMVGLAGLASGWWHREVSRGNLKAASMSVGVACLLAGAFRYVAHVVSGAVFFGEYAPPGQPVLAYSAIYNVYVLLSAGLAFAAAVLLLPALERAVPSTSRREGL